MKKIYLTALFSLHVASTSAIAATFTLGDVLNGINKAVSTSSDSSSVTNSVSTVSNDVLVKDLPNLPKLAEKPFVRGIAKIDYSEIYFTGNTRDHNSKILGHETSEANWIIRFNMANETKNTLRFQEDALSRKVFQRMRPTTVFSNPYSSQVEFFDLSSLNELSRADKSTIYTYTIGTHIKIPDEFIKKGKVVIESDKMPVLKHLNYSSGNDKKQGINQICYQTINGDFTHDKKGTYSVKKGSLIDYSITCYFNGSPQALKSTQESAAVLPKSLNIYSVSDPLAKESGQVYKITNRDMFLYENEVYPAK